MKRVLPFIALLVAAPATGASTQRYNESYPCYWVHGRLTAANGNPLWRIWPVGTKRILGVVGDRPGADADFENWPVTLKSADPGFDRIVWANFKVCPVSPERAGWMRFVHIKDAKVLRVETTNS
jgi:hypothetical protein